MNVKDEYADVDWEEYDEDYTLWIMFDQLQSLIRRARERELRRSGLLYMQSTILNTLVNANRSMTPAEISRQLFREPNSISYIIRRMEKVGLIKVKRSDVRKNQLKVILTEKGHQAQLLSITRDSIYTIFDVLTKQQKKQMRIIAQKLWYKGLEVGEFPEKRSMPKFH
jgi:DNA-binding MarR family transcriptional regulator